MVSPNGRQLSSVTRLAHAAGRPVDEERKAKEKSYALHRRTHSNSRTVVVCRRRLDHTSSPRRHRVGEDDDIDIVYDNNG